MSSLNDGAPGDGTAEGPEGPTNGGGHTTVQTAPSEKQYRASVQGPSVLPPDFVTAVRALEQKLEMPVWMMALSHSTERHIDQRLYRLLFKERGQLEEGKPIALLLDSPGGTAGAAYQIGMLLRQRCGSVTVVVPRYAKSAATLLSFCGDELILGDHAELGPLDVQISDPEREDIISALDEVHALERLHAVALESVDRAMTMFLGRTGKKVDTLLPSTANLISSLMQPLFATIDVVHYTQMSRLLKVAEEYAIRLLIPRYERDDAERIARALISGYPEHGFVIDRSEAARIGLSTERPDDETCKILDRLWPHLCSVTAIGALQEVTP